MSGGACVKGTAYHHGDLREDLLRAAEGLLRAGDLNAVTLRACARAAGVSHAAPQHHFRDLSDLLAETAARGYKRLGAALAAALALAPASPEARFLAVGRTYVRFAREESELFRLMFRADRLNATNEALRAERLACYAQMATAVSGMRGEPPVSAAELPGRRQDGLWLEDILISWSYVHGFALLVLEGELDRLLTERWEGTRAPMDAHSDLDAMTDRILEQTARRLGAIIQVAPAET